LGSQPVRGWTQPTRTLTGIERESPPIHRAQPAPDSALAYALTRSRLLRFVSEGVGSPRGTVSSRGTV